MSLLLALTACVFGDPYRDTDGTIPPPDGADLTDDTTPVVQSSVECGSCGGECVIEELLYTERYHTTDAIDYAVAPPAGGPHHPCWTSWGVHEDVVADDHWVHNLEHGGVVVLHACTDCEADVTAIRATATALGDFVVTTEYPAMDTAFAAVAWGWRMQATCFDPAGVEAFYTAHVDQGPESTMAEPGEGCM